jgi:hypothetical protein
MRLRTAAVGFGASLVRETRMVANAVTSLSRCLAFKLEQPPTARTAPSDQMTRTYVGSGRKLRANRANRRDS